MERSADEIDAALVAAGFADIAAHGWQRLNLVRAAREAGVAPEIARRRIAGRCALLLRFGALADAHALEAAPPEGPVRDRLFDILMRRIDFLQTHRDGVVALLRALPADPLAAGLLSAASLRSMAWLLEAAGVGARSPAGAVRAAGLMAVWGWTVRAWERDTSEDLSATMAALDHALGRAERAAGWLAARGRPEPPVPPTDTAHEEPDHGK